MSSTFILLVSGKSKSGKDYFCSLLREIDRENGNKLDFHRIALADQLKAFTAKALNIEESELHDPTKKEKWRPYLIFGGMLGRMISPSTWCTFINGSEEYKTRNLIIPDVRFINEVQWFKTSYIHKPAFLVRIHADEDTRLFRGANKGVFDDITETELDNVTYDFVLDNSIPTSLSFYEQVLKFYQDLLIYERFARCGTSDTGV